MRRSFLVSLGFFLSSLAAPSSDNINPSSTAAAPPPVSTVCGEIVNNKSKRFPAGNGESN